MTTKFTKCYILTTPKATPVLHYFLLGEMTADLKVYVRKATDAASRKKQQPAHLCDDGCGGALRFSSCNRHYIQTQKKRKKNQTVDSQYFHLGAKIACYDMIWVCLQQTDRTHSSFNSHYGSCQTHHRHFPGYT